MECGQLSVAEVTTPEALSEAGAERPEEHLAAAKALRAALEARGFATGTELLLVLRAHDKNATPSEDTQNSPLERLLGTLSGLYYRMSSQYGDRPCYQHVSFNANENTRGLVCRGLYIFWNSERSLWQIGSLSDNMAGLAFSKVKNSASPVSAGRAWMVFMGGQAQPDDEPAGS